MGLIPDSKYKLDGIGGVSASAVIAALAAYPPTAFLAKGVLGKMLYILLKYLFSFLASSGLVMLNLGAEQILVAVEKSNYDGSWESAQKLIDAIRATGRELTPEETAKIDQGVIDAFRKFGKLTRKHG